MRRTLPMLLGTLAVVALFGAGCPIWIEEEGGGTVHVCGGSGCECRDHTDCDPGYACIDGTCVSTGNCFYGMPCPDGYVCDIWGTCVPEATVTCDEDADCEVGYCDLDAGRCVRTGICSLDADCAGYGPSFICDDRGVCVPDRGPCPDGSCGCANDGECREMGPAGEDWWCEEGRCHDPAALCVYDHQCPAGTLCHDSFCRVDCSSATCPTGQICQGGVCFDDPDGGGECTYSTECSGGLCVNGYCVATCGTSVECGAFETCESSMCLPSVTVQPACIAADCTGGLSCVDGVCRMPCAGDINCAGSAPFLSCWAGFCRTPNEIADQCDRRSDCPSGLSCADGACL